MEEHPGGQKLSASAPVCTKRSAPRSRQPPACCTAPLLSEVGRLSVPPIKRADISGGDFMATHDFIPRISRSSSTTAIPHRADGEAWVQHPPIPSSRGLRSTRFHRDRRSRAACGWRSLLFAVRRDRRVLIRGEKGTGESTAFVPWPTCWPRWTAHRWSSCPSVATEYRVVGSLDLHKLLRERRTRVLARPCWPRCPRCEMLLTSTRSPCCTTISTYLYP